MNTDERLDNEREHDANLFVLIIRLGWIQIGFDELGDSVRWSGPFHHVEKMYPLSGFLSSRGKVLCLSLEEITLQALVCETFPEDADFRLR